MGGIKNGRAKTMAIARKCDRCGKLYECYAGAKEFKTGEKANGIILIDRGPDGLRLSLRTYDLCVDCMGALEAFIRGANGRNDD